MPRLTVFAKGNVDVRDALHAAVVGGVVRWNGINEVVRSRFPGWTVRLRHETWARSDALLQAVDAPPEIAARALGLGAHSLAAQSSRALFTTPAAAVVLSIQADVTTRLVRHKKSGYLFLPHLAESWPAADRDWLRREFEPTRLLTPEESAAHFIRIANRVREATGAAVLVFNLSSVVPGETLHWHPPGTEPLSTRIRRFNLSLLDVSATAGVSVVDVDAIVARAGADRLKVDAVHLTPEGLRLVAEETVRIMADLGCFEQTSEPAEGVA